MMCVCTKNQISLYSCHFCDYSIQFRIVYGPILP